MAPLLRADSSITVREFADVGAAVPKLKRGDIITYAWPPDTSKVFVHRLLGLPGDTLAMIHGVLSVNGSPLREPYAWREGSGTDSSSTDFAWQREYLIAERAVGPKPGRADWGPLAIPAGFLFVLGDNRDNSLDSRWWGLLPTHNVRGLVQLR